jgi:hypothetical protein
MDILTAVAETSVFIAKASRIMSDIERAEIVDIVAARPDAGVRITGSKELRKMRIALAGRGKRGGGRIILVSFSGLSGGAFMGICKE